MNDGIIYIYIYIYICMQHTIQFENLDGGRSSPRVASPFDFSQSILILSRWMPRVEMFHRQMHMLELWALSAAKLKAKAKAKAKARQGRRVKARMRIVQYSYSTVG